MKLRHLRRRTIARMGPVRAITARRLAREMSAVFASAFEAQANQSRVLAQGIRDMVRREVVRAVLRPIIADFVRGLHGTPPAPDHIEHEQP
jgi:hypothetical protein